MPNNTLLEVKDLKMYFENKKGFLGKKIEYVKAVDGVSFKIQKGETIGLVGESGCGKSTTGYSIMRLYKPTAGEIIFDGKDIAQLSAAEVWPYRKRMQMIFQDPYASLNPKIKIGNAIAEPMLLHGQASSYAEAKEKIQHLLEVVGLQPAVFDRYPHEFSGGQRQRISIARALIRNPKVIVLDEATSALDSISEKLIQEALNNLTKDRTTFIVAHRLSTIKDADKIAVIADGHCVEYGTYDELMNLKGEFYQMKKIQS